MKKFISLVLILIIAFSLVSCTSEKSKDVDVENPEGKDNIVDDNNGDTSEPSSDINEKKVVLYFANNEYVETGDEELDHLLPEERLIEYKDMSLEEAIVRELMKGPESSELGNPIPDTAKLLGVEVRDKTAFVNFAEEGLNGGSMQEDFTISQIVNSLLELGSVDKVQFLIEGEKAESLMGHFDTMEPFDSKLE